jgi:hypothetical protein
MKLRPLAVQFSVALLVALMIFVPLAVPVTAAMTGRVFEEVVEEHGKFLHQSPTEARHKRPQTQKSRVLSTTAPAQPALPELPERPLCFWFSVPPLLRAPPALA